MRCSPIPALLGVMLALDVTSGAGAQEPPKAEAARPAAHNLVYLIGALRLSRPRIVSSQNGEGDVALLDIQNRGGASEKLIGAGVEGATDTGLTGTAGAADAIEIPGRSTVSMSPGSARLVLHGLPQAADPGGRVTGTLRFARSGDLRVTFVRDPAGDDTPPASVDRPVDLAQ